MGNQNKSEIKFTAGRLIACLLIAFALSGCVTLSDPETSQEHNSAVVAVLQPGHTLAQSFTSRRPGLNRITLWFTSSPEESPMGSVLVASLYHSSQDAVPLRQVNVPLALTASASPVLVSFDPLDDPPGQNYYLSLQVQEGGVHAMGRDEDIYADGSAYLDGIPQPFDLAFSSSYIYAFPALLTDFVQFVHDSPVILPLAVILLLPGWLLLRFFQDEKKANLAERIALSLGLSLAFIPTLMVWTTALNLRWSRPSVLFVAGLSCAAALYLAIKSLVTARAIPRKPDPIPLDTKTPDTVAPDTSHLLLILLLFSVTLAARLIMVRDLAASPWVDSVHHATLTRLILEQGVLPSSYAPYIEIDTASYHAGFHAFLAFFTWLSGLSIPASMLLLGQVLNASIVFPVYLLGVRLTRLPQAGLIAALIAGLFTPMPAYYTSWGRYTQLASLLILPAAFALVQDLALILSSGGWTRLNRWKVVRLAILTATACAGLFLTHYRVAAFLACLLGSDLVVRLVTSRRAGTGFRPVHLLAGSVIAGALAIFLALPWLPSALSTLFIPKLAAWRGGNPDFFSGFAPTYLTTAWGWPAMVLAGIGLVWGLLRRKAFTIVLVGWSLLMFLLANLEPLGLPGGGFITNLSVAITLFMPISIAGGFVIGDLKSILERSVIGRWPGMNIAWGLALLATAVLAARVQIPILRSLTFLARQADLPAIEWVSENVPTGETILINPAAWGYSFYQGQDGGFWIAPLAGRPTLPPPVLYGLDNDPVRAEAINRLSQQVIDLRADPHGLHRLLVDHNIRYLYLGARGGVLSPHLLRQNRLFEVIYSYRGVWIFRLK